MLWIVMLSYYHPSPNGSTESKRPRAVEPPTYLIRFGAARTTCARRIGPHLGPRTLKSKYRASDLPIANRARSY
jgi:hypothetical protein